MILTARVVTGVQALYVVMTGDRRTVAAMITREALEECWHVGPEQDDLLGAFAAHKDEIAAAVRHLSKTAAEDSFLIKDLVAVMAPSQKSRRAARSFESVGGRPRPTAARRGNDRSSVRRPERSR